MVAFGIAAVCFGLLVLWREHERLEMRARVRELEAALSLSKCLTRMADKQAAAATESAVEAWKFAATVGDAALESGRAS